MKIGRFKGNVSLDFKEPTQPCRRRLRRCIAARGAAPPRLTRRACAPPRCGAAACSPAGPAPGSRRPHTPLPGRGSRTLGGGRGVGGWGAVGGWLVGGGAAGAMRCSGPGVCVGCVCVLGGGGAESPRLRSGGAASKHAARPARRRTAPRRRRASPARCGSVDLKAAKAKGLEKILWNAGAAGFISMMAATPPGLSSLGGGGVGAGPGPGLGPG
jgi:hypothetical protein